MDRNEWLEARRKCITGTDIAKICGMSPWGSAMDVYLEKLQLVEEQPDNPAMYWGRALEGAIAQKYAEETGTELEPGEWTVRDGWMGATPDRLVKGVDKGLEIKTAGFRTARQFGEPGTDQIPDQYALQCAWYMAVSGRSEWDLAVLINGSDYRVYNVKRSLRLENRIVELANKFREQHILAKVPPAIDGSRAAEEYLRTVFPRNKNADLKHATPEIEDLVAKLAEAKQLAAEADNKVCEYENLIKAQIGNDSGFQGESWKITWRAGKESAAIDYKGLLAELKPSQELIKRYTTAKAGSRRFLFTINNQ